MMIAGLWTIYGKLLLHRARKVDRDIGCDMNILLAGDDSKVFALETVNIFGEMLALNDLIVIPGPFNSRKKT